MNGSAASYYNPSQDFGFQGRPYAYNTNGTNGYDPCDGDYQRPPPSQPQQPVLDAKPAAPPPYPDNPPPYSTFDEAFKIDRPKYNDIWAGLLVRALEIPIARCRANDRVS